MKKDEIIKESNAVARACIKPKTDSVWEERIIAILLSKVRMEDKIFNEQVIPFEELGNGGELSTREHAEAKKAINKLSDKKYIMPQGWRGIMIYPIFEHIGIDDAGNITAKLNPGLCEHYIELKGHFALRSLPEFRALSGTYAQQMYRFLNSWRAQGEVRVDIKDLHELLATPETFKKDFAGFRRRVLEPVAEEINKKTDLKYTWKPIIKGRGGKVVAVKFTFAATLPAPKATMKSTSASTPAPTKTIDPDDIVTPEQMAADLERLGLRGGVIGSALMGLAGGANMAATQKEQKEALKRIGNRQLTIDDYVVATAAETPKPEAAAIASEAPTPNTVAPIGAESPEEPLKFLEFWLVYPRQTDKDKAFAAWRSAVDGGADADDLITAAQEYTAALRPSQKAMPKTIKRADKFLLTGIWRDYVDVDTDNDAAEPQNAFLAAARDLAKKREFIRICDLRARLGWARTDFDTMLGTLSDSGTIQLHAGDVTKQTPQEVDDGYIDDNGYRMGNITLMRS